MGGKTDVVKGKIKEAAGVLTGNDRLRAEGQADQAGGKVKQAATKVVNKVKKATEIGARVKLSQRRNRRPSLNRRRLLFRLVRTTTPAIHRAGL